MGKWIIGFLARTVSAWNTTANKSLQSQLAAARMEARRTQDNYLVLVDEHADLRVTLANRTAAYEELAFERLNAWGIMRAGGVEFPGTVMRVAGNRRRSAPTAGDR